MASTPPETKFRKEDFPSTGLGTQDALDKLFLPLNAFAKAVRDALNGNLTSDNAREEWKTVTITTPSTGTGVLSCFPFNMSSKVNPIQGLSLEACFDMSTSPGVPSLGVPSWLLNADGTIRVTNVPGLLLGRTYRLTFLIKGG